MSRYYDELDRVDATLGPIGVESSRRREVLRSAATIIPRAVRRVWLNRIAIGKFTIIDGRPGLGKSTTVTDLTSRITRGLPMPDGYDPGIGPANVLLVTAEDDWEDTVVPRLMACGADLDRVYQLEELSLPDGCDELEERIREVEAVFVGIDPLVAFVGPKYNLYRDQDARNVLKPLSRALERTGAAGLGLRHVSKASGIPAQDRGTGSVAIGGAARSNLIVGPDPDMEDRFVLASIKNNLGRKPASLGYRVAAKPIDLPDGETIWAPYIDWEGEVELDADDLVSPEKQGEAATFLKQQLADGPVASKVLEEEARARGLSWSGAVRRASERLGIVKKPDAVGVKGAGWTWALPDVPTPPLKTHNSHNTEGDTSGVERRIERIEQGSDRTTVPLDEVSRRYFASIGEDPAA